MKSESYYTIDTVHVVILCNHVKKSALVIAPFNVSSVFMQLFLWHIQVEWPKQ